MCSCENKHWFVLRVTCSGLKYQVFTIPPFSLDAASEEYKRAFKHEISLLSEIDKHENLLGLIGCCTAGNQSWYMVTQFMKYGDLLNFLWKSREVSDIYKQSSLCGLYRYGGIIRRHYTTPKPKSFEIRISPRRFVRIKYFVCFHLHVPSNQRS